MKKYSIVGNKKKVSMDINASKLKVVGNNCVVIVKINQGDVDVIGNGCRVEIEENYGSVSMVGGNGLVSIGRRWKGDRVQIVGPTSHLNVGGMEKPHAFEAQLSPFSKELDDVIESIFTFVMR